MAGKIGRASLYILVGVLFILLGAAISGLVAREKGGRARSTARKSSGAPGTRASRATIPW